MVSENIKYLREEVLGMTRKFMAAKIGYTETAVKYWEHGINPPTPRARDELCRFFNRRIPGLNLTPDRLMGEDLSRNGKAIQALVDHKHLPVE